jgi:glycosyltransferase involved in cell wall biosynthesis
MAKKTVLYVVHNHPTVRPGGAEAYALELYEAMQESSEFEPLLLARTGPPVSATPQVHGGTPFQHVNSDPNQYFFYTNGEFDWFHGVLKAKEALTFHFRGFLEATRPDIVHFQHTQRLGYDMIRQVRNTLPDCPIIHTLHEYLPICHRQGQMLRSGDNSLCMESSPRRCHECFPQYSPQDFFMRKSFIKSHLSEVDLFIAPSRFLLQRYIDWGIPCERIVYEEYGRKRMAWTPDAELDRPRNRLAFFGQMTPYKGVDVLLEAMRLLGERQPNGVEGDQALAAHTTERPRPELRICGANLDLAESSFQSRLRALLDQTRQDVSLIGQYDHSQLSSLMRDVDWVVVPSIWWENSPLVIQEAFAHHRPVICSNIGAMAEKVSNGLNGLHFRAGDARALAETIERATATAGLWEALCRGIPEVYSMHPHTNVLGALYNRVLEAKAVRGSS